MLAAVTPSAVSTSAAFCAVANPNNRRPDCCHASASAPTVNDFPVPAAAVITSTRAPEVSTPRTAAA